ncbi:DUF262 domain-containing protein [Rhizobium leguminosarum]|uniref:DUF262 domain-containing protein n=1 Tax=Rhizobium leguminosarum TaxID=384 RepID=UPI00103C6180|nr:DUF262 domain-containing protein [Rhizobium leguminosarum]TCA55154.1 DUF262 domain-containing protein [Rhizobium leguminosarum bv. viciae]TCB15916.1 DUF262 domain-containing protein [Rhizobium leguminosarum bv. viciae]
MITAHQHTVFEVLGDRFLHEIPGYQRPYAWRTEEAGQLLVDLLEALEQATDEPYFLGSIVLIKPTGELVGQVLDGQQRLTTLTILGAVLRDLATAAQEKSALDSIVYIEPNAFLNQQEAIRLRAHEDDRVFFKESIQRPGATAKAQPSEQPKTEAQKNMWANAQALRSMVLELTEKTRQSLVTFLINKCVLVVVSTESRAAALRIFKVLNDRGLDLTNADVIKADLLAKFGNEEEMRHQAQRWRNYENELGRQEFEGLLETLRFIKEESKNRRTLSDAYTERFKDANAVDVRSFLDEELAPAKIQYERIIQVDASGFPEAMRPAAEEALAGLSLVPNKDWVPVALAASLTLEPGYLLETLEGLEGVAWMMQLSRKYDNQRMNRYVEILKAMNDPEKLRASLRLTPDEAQEGREALGGALYNKFPTRVVRAILERLDRLLSEQPVEWSGQKTVEHILPQNPGNGWVSFADADRVRITDTLGNLVLLTSRKNSSASNLPYADKVKVYFGLGQGTASSKRATYASAQELAHILEWDLIAYDARHARHVDILSKRWRLG